MQYRALEDPFTCRLPDYAASKLRADTLWGGCLILVTRFVGIIKGSRGR